MESHTTWFNRTTNTSGRQAAIKAGLPIATVNRQLGRDELSAETVIAIARAYGQSPIGALISTGYLNEDETKGIGIEDALKFASDQALIHQLAMRVNDNESHWQGTFEEVIDNPYPPLRDVSDSSPDEDALRAQEEGGDWSDPDHMS